MKSISVALLTVVALTLSAGLVRALDPPYQADMVRLGHIMGALHHLDELCLQTGLNWRDDFAKLVDSDQVDDSRRSRLMEAFNQGYADYSGLHIKCTGNTRLLLQRFALEGERISDSIYSRFAE